MNQKRGRNKVTQICNQKSPHFESKTIYLPYTENSECDPKANISKFDSPIDQHYGTESDHHPRQIRNRKDHQTGHNL